MINRWQYLSNINIFSLFQDLQHFGIPLAVPELVDPFAELVVGRRQVNLSRDHTFGHVGKKIDDHLSLVFHGRF